MSYEYEENQIEYYLATLKNVKLGPQIKKKSDFREEDIKTIEKLISRFSINIGHSLELEIGDTITFNAAVNQDNYIGLLTKRATKVKKI